MEKVRVSKHLKIVNLSFLLEYTWGWLDSKHMVNFSNVLWSSVVILDIIFRCVDSVQKITDHLYELF